MSFYSLIYYQKCVTSQLECFKKELHIKFEEEEGGGKNLKLLRDADAGKGGGSKITKKVLK